MKITIGLTVTALLALCGTASAASVNLVSNGSFELGTLGIGSFQGWQTTLGDISTFVDSSGQTGTLYGDATDGFWAAYFGSTAMDGGASIAQSLATSANQAYLLSFDLANDNGDLPPVNSFLVSLGNVTAFSFTNETNQDFLHYTYAFTASSATTNLQFAGSNDNSYFELDNVVVNAVPEPSTFALLLMGTLAIGVALCRAVSRADRG